MMFSWFSCTEQKRTSKDISFDVFVEESVLKEGEDGVLHMIVEHTQAYTHQITRPKSHTMEFFLLSRSENQPSSLLRTHYQYRFTGYNLIGRFYLRL